MASAVLQASSTADAQTNASLIQGAVQVVTGRGKARIAGMPCSLLELFMPGTG